MSRIATATRSNGRPARALTSRASDSLPAAINVNTPSSTGMRIDATCSIRVPSAVIARAAASSRRDTAATLATSMPGYQWT